eukprot:scaffold214_cov249-Pinguiococcus_pyrenoidosus.AAC.11
MKRLEEGQKRHLAPLALVPQLRRVPIKIADHLLGEQEHVVLCEPLLVEHGLDVPQQPRQARGRVLLAHHAGREREEVGHPEDALAVGLEQGGGMSHGGLLVGNHTETIGHRHNIYSALLRQGLESVLAGEVLLDDLHNVLDAHGRHAALGLLEKAGADVEHDDLLELLADELHGQELEVPSGSPADVDPHETSRLLHWERVHKPRAREEQLLAERIVVSLLVRVERLHGLRMLGLSARAERQDRLQDGEGHDLDARPELVDDPAGRLGQGVNARGRLDGRVVQVGDPGAEVHADAVARVVHAQRLEPHQRRRVDRVRVRAPEDAAASSVHLGGERVDLAADVGDGHPVHVIQEGGNREGAALRGLAGRHEGPVHEVKLAGVDALAQLLVVLPAAVARAVGLRPVAQQVAGVEVVVAAEVGVVDDVLQHALQGVGAVRAEVQLALGHAGEEAAEAVEHGVHEPGHHLELHLVVLRDADELLLRRLVAHALHDPAEAGQGEAEARQEPGKLAAGAGVQDGFAVGQEAVPELHGRRQQVLLQLRVVLAEHVDVLRREDGEEVLEGQQLDAHLLHVHQRDLGHVEIHRRHLGALDEVVQDVAARGRNRDHVVVILRTKIS